MEQKSDVNLTETSSSSSSSSSSSDSDCSLAISNAVIYLEANKGFEIVQTLGKGSYGKVFLINDPHEKITKAMKVVYGENLSQLEIELWPKLKHTNILSTEDPIKVQETAVAFLSPLKMKGLDDLLKKKTFKSYPSCIQLLKVWLKEALLGIEYMHSNSYCHLDIKSDNILIGFDGHACVADFSFINYTDKLLTSELVGLPRVYKPPELFENESETTVKGIAVDIWGLGMLILESFTNDYIFHKKRIIRNWQQIKSTLSKLLVKEILQRIMQRTFPLYTHTDENSQLLLNFVKTFLQEEVEARTTTNQALKHLFFDQVADFEIPVNDLCSKINVKSDTESSSDSDSDSEVDKFYDASDKVIVLGNTASEDEIQINGSTNMTDSKTSKLNAYGDTDDDNDSDMSNELDTISSFIC